MIEPVPPTSENSLPAGPDPSGPEGDQLEYLQQVVSLGEYRVDSEQVATAMLERIGAAMDRAHLSERGGDRVLKQALTDLRVA
jgi:hypothetical protein